MLLRSRRAHHVAPLPLVDAPSRRLSESGSTTADFEADVAKRAAEFLAAALRGEARIIGSASPQLGDAPAAADVPSPKGHRPKRHASGKVDYTSDTPPSEASQTLRAQWKQIWSKNSSPSWGARSCDAWGGVGYTIELDDGDGGRMHVGWDHHVESVAERFDEQDRRFSNQADLLRARPLSLSSAALSHDAGGGRRMMSTELHNCLDGLASNRFNVQALRLTTNNVAPSDRRGAKEFMKPLALAAGVWGGPLVPVYERHFATENVEEEEEEEEEVVVHFSLYNSIWGPRAEWCDGRDFFDHTEVLAERCLTDWQICLRLGAGKVICSSDEDGTEDADGDGVPDEVEDVGAVLCANHELLCMAFSCYADAVYGSGDDLDIGMKQNDGWKAILEDTGVWGDLPTAKAAGNNALIFMSNDKIDLATCAVISSQSTYRGRLRGRDGKPPVPAPRFPGLEKSAPKEIDDGLDAASKAAVTAMQDATNAFKVRQTRMLTRPEFICALIKTSVEKFVKTKQNPKNEMDDVSDALEWMLTEHFHKRLLVPQEGPATLMGPPSPRARPHLRDTQPVGPH